MNIISNPKFHVKNHPRNKKMLQITPQPLYNTVPYDTVLDTTRIRVGPQIAI